MAASIQIELKGIDHATQVVNNVKLSLNQLNNTAQNSGDGITASLRRIGETAAGFLTAQAIPALANMGRQALAVATDYQGAMNIMQAVSGATADQMALVGQKAKGLGADMSLPATSAGDAALAMVELSKAGLSVEQSMAAAKGVLQLSAAGAIGNAQAAEIAANAMNAFGIAGERVSMIANMFAAAANASSVEVRDIGDAFAMTAAVWSSFQGPVRGAEGAIQDLTTAIGVLGNAGIKGSDAGTSLKQMLLQLTGPSNTAKNAMRALYMATQEVTIGEELMQMALRGTADERAEAMNQIAQLTGMTAQHGDIAYDAAGKMRPLEDIIRLVAQGTRNMSEEQRNAAITQIFGADATRAVIALMRSMSDQAVEAGTSFGQMSEKLNNQSAAADLAAARMAGLGGAWQGLQSQIETALLDLAEPAMPFLESIVRQIADTVPKAVTQVQAIGAGVLAAIAGFQAGLVAGAGTATANLLVGVGLSSETAGQVGALIAQIQVAVQSGLAQITAAWAANGPQITAFVMQVLAILGQLAGFLASQLPAAITLVTSAIALLISNWQAVATVVGLVAGAIVGSQIAALVTALAGAFSLVSGAAAAAGGIIPLVGVVVAALGGPITIIIAIVGALAAAWATNFMGIRDHTANAWAAIQAAFATGQAAVQSAIAWLGQAWAQIASATQTAWNSIVAGLASVWTTITTTVTNGLTNLQTSISTAWANITTTWNTAWTVIKLADSVAWATVTTLASTAWGNIQATTANAWNSVQGAWNGAWSSLQSLTSGAWNTVQGQWNTGWANVRSASASGWSTVQSGWQSGWSSLQSATNSAWGTVQSAWNSAWGNIRSASAAGWSTVETGWQQGWLGLQGVTATAWAGVQVVTAQAWGVVVGLTQQAWATVTGIWNEAVAFVQGLLDRLGGAFEGVSAAIRGTIAALKKLADTAASIGDAIPDWMRPGSPMPLGIAFEHLAGATADAAGGLKQVGSAMAGAAGRVTLGLDLQLTLNGQPVGSGSDTGAMADNVSKTMTLLTTVMGVVSQAIAFWNNEQQRFAISTGEGRGWISGIADFLGQLGAELINVLAPSLGRLNEGAAAAAKTFGESLAPIQSLSTVMSFTTAAIAFWADATQRFAISTGEGRGWIAGIASFVSQLAALIVNEMGNAVSGLAAGAADGAARLGNALKPIQDLGVVMTFTTAAIAFWAVPAQQMAIATAEGRGWIAGIASFVSQLGALILNEMSAGAALLQQGAVSGAQTLSGGLGALQGLTSVMGLVPGILALWNDAGQNALVMTAVGRDTAKQVVAALVQLGVAWLTELNTGAGQVTGVNEEATSAAAKLVNLTVGFVTDTIQIVNTVNGYLKAGGLSLSVEDAKTFVRKLVEWGLALAGEFETGTAAYTGSVTPAATEFSKSIDLLAKVTDDIAKFEEKVGKVDVRSESDLAALKTKIGTAIDQLKGLVQVFLDGANAFSGQPLIGAENLTKGMDQLQKIISDQAAVLKKLADEDLSISAETETKVVQAIEAAKRLVGLFFESGNTTPAVGNSLGDRVRELVASLASLGSLGNVAEAALASMSTLMASLVAVAAEAGGNAGTAFITQMAAAMRAGGDALKSALGGALSGVSASLSAAATSVGQSSRGQGAGAAANSTPAANTGPSSVTVINFNQYVSSGPVAADAANSVILLKSQFARGL